MWKESFENLTFTRHREDKMERGKESATYLKGLCKCGWYDMNREG